MHGSRPHVTFVHGCQTSELSLHSVFIAPTGREQVSAPERPTGDRKGAPDKAIAYPLACVGLRHDSTCKPLSRRLHRAEDLLAFQFGILHLALTPTCPTPC
jgi:hypothetical protein